MNFRTKNLSELDDGKIGVECQEQEMPSWSGFNSLVTDEDLPERIVGFLPILPHPVTEYSTVYTSLKNFQNILAQLDQENMAVMCDEGVYRIAREIQSQNPQEFKNIMGFFHPTKILMACIGKYIEGSGAETIWVQNEILGVNVVHHAKIK